jgi:hypothetical protein
VVELPHADCCPRVEKLRTVLPLTVGIRDGVVQLVSTLGRVIGMWKPKPQPHDLEVISFSCFKTLRKTTTSLTFNVGERREATAPGPPQPGRRVLPPSSAAQQPGAHPHCLPW